MALMLTALALVPAGTHLLALPNKIGLPQDQYFIVQGIYRGWAFLGAVLMAAIDTCRDRQLDATDGRLGSIAPAVGIFPRRQCRCDLRILLLDGLIGSTRPLIGPEPALRPGTAATVPLLCQVRRRSAQGRDAAVTASSVASTGSYPDQWVGSLRQTGFAHAFDEAVARGQITKRLSFDPIADLEMGVQYEKESAFLTRLVQSAKLRQGRGQ